MKNHPGIRSKHLIDRKTVWTDSNMEAEFINKLVTEGFSGLWRRSRFGIGYGAARYTPDLELSIHHDNMNRRALVEFKPNSVRDFPIERRRAMLTASHFYKDSICLLYVKKIDMWFQVEPDGKLHEFGTPQPGGLPLKKLSRPRIAFPIINPYGRAYFVRPGNFFMKKTLDGTEEFFKAFFFSPKYKSRRKRK